MTLDLIIKNSQVLDGTGSKPQKIDVGILGKKIEHIGKLENVTAKRVIDANGLVLSPGFIDVHAHADAALLIDGKHKSGILQGITTEIITPDGIGLAPLSKPNYLQHRQYISGILGLPPKDVDTSSIDAFMRNYHLRTSCNVAMFLGHGPVRLQSAGFADVPLVGNLLKTAMNIVEESMEQGVCGFSTGLSYYPQSYSDTREIVELCKVVARYGLPFSIHLRNHNTDRAIEGGGVLEAIAIAKLSGVKLHIEHYRTQPESAGMLQELLEPVDMAKKEGVDITLETYGYPVGSSYPAQFFPGWVNEGGTDKLLNRLADRKLRKQILKALQTQMPQGVQDNCWTWIGSEQNARFQGMSFSDTAKIRNETVEDMVINMMLEENLTCGFRGLPPESPIIWRQVEADIMQTMQRDDYMIGSDSISVGSMPHPRAWGCFARMLGRLRRRHNIPLPTLIQRVTQNPATRFGLKNRGIIKENAYADITIFDEQHINDTATFEDPMQPPQGIQFVIVNGELTVDNEVYTGALSGEAIRSNS